MFTVRLQGGLGNMMFQIAWAEYASQKYGIGVCYANLEEQFDTISKLPRSPHARDYLTIFSNFNWYKNKEHWDDSYIPKYVPFHYTDIIPQDGIEYRGYFQSEMFFESDEQFICKLFEPNHAIIQYCIDNRDYWSSCFIHVRRADYLKIPDFHPNLSADYYFNAIDIMREKGVDDFTVFSDDIEWCKKAFKGCGFKFISDIDYKELFLMVYCDYAILSNSSFAWWGAYLGGKIYAIAPKKWLGDACKDDQRNIIPPDWHTL